jgi:tetratricopeptide (TPR) repeat protein
MSASAALSPGWRSLPALAWLALAAPLPADGQDPPGPAPATADTAGAGAHLPSPGPIRNGADWPAPGDQYRRAYRESLANGELLEAETAAKQLIDHLNATGDTGFRPMADALASLAYAQRGRERFEPAAANYEAAIALLEAGENRLSASLIEPLSALADTYAASGRPDLAASVYRRALHVAQVNEGPHTLRQAELLDAMSQALLDSGDRDAALHAVDAMYRLYTYAFSPRAEEVVPALERKARLLEALGRYDEERTVYRRIANIVADHHGEEDLRLFDTYLALAHTYFHDLDEVYFRSEPTTETGETFLEKALELTERNPQATWRMQAEALLALADYYTLRDVQDKARIHYRRAWELLSAATERLPMRQRELERTVALIAPHLDAVARFGYGKRDETADPADYEEGHVVARYRVNDRGRVTDVEVVAADPPGLEGMETHVVYGLRRLVFRPRHVAGEPVATPGQVFRHDYRYPASGLRARRNAGD